MAHRAVPACREERPAPPEDQCRVGPANAEPSTALAAGSTPGLGQRGRLGRGGAAVGANPSGSGLTLAGGCGALSSAGPPVARHAWPQTPSRQTPAGLARVGGSLRYPLGGRGGTLVRRPARTSGGLLTHGPVVHPAAEVRAHRGLETPRPWSARPSPARRPSCWPCSHSSRSWQLSPGGQLSAPMTAWSRHSEPTFANGRVLVRWHFWRARYVVNSTPEVESMQFPPEVFELLFNGLPLAA